MRRQIMIERKFTLPKLAGNLYVTDLDGTLLNTEGKLSTSAIKRLNFLLPRMNITFATAREYAAATPPLAQLDINLPLIVANGAFIYDPETGSPIEACYHSQATLIYLDALFRQCYPLTPHVHTRIANRDIVIFYPESLSDGGKYYADHAQNPERFRLLPGPVAKAKLDNLYAGDVYCINLIDSYSVLLPIYEELKNKSELFILFQQELYRPEWWLAVYPATAHKGLALNKLKNLIPGIKRVITFGDTDNDLPLLTASDYGIAVANASDVLKTKANLVIGANYEEAVINYLWHEYLTNYPD